MFDVIVIGGSFAGLSAAMQLARASRTVLVLDDEKPRNITAPASHGFFGQDGRSPAEIRKIGMDQLSAYPTFSHQAGTAESVEKRNDRFRVILSDGSDVETYRLILASGVRDDLPEIDGLQERWGVSVLHCPYCHGYEVKDRALGVLANDPAHIYHAMLVSEWGPTVLFTQGKFEVSDDQLTLLQNRQIRVESQPIQRLVGATPQLDGVNLSDGQFVPLSALFVVPRVRPRDIFAKFFGCQMEQGPLGPYIITDQWQETSVPGVFAAGDAADFFHNATRASAGGVMAGIGAHRSLVLAGIRQA